MTDTPWLSVHHGQAPLVVSMPHTGTQLADVEANFVSPWRARCDTDWWIDQLYDFAADLGATVIHTAISRSVIDVNRDPSGASLYPGQTTTGLCPTETFDGLPLYREAAEPAPGEIARRREMFFDPYHVAIRQEIARLRASHERVVLYDCHSIRSVIPRLFEGTLPVFNLGTNDGKSADAGLAESVRAVMAASGRSWVVNGRFKGGWITRDFGRPEAGIHALQMELSTRGYMREAEGVVGPDNWPTPYDPAYAADMRATLTTILETALNFARG